MKRLLKIFAFVIPGTFAQQLQPVAGSISGNLRGDDGSAISGGIIILHREPTEKSRMARQRTDWSTVTAATGVFQFSGLPEGNYTLCPHVQNSTWLSPCQWNFPTPTATISRLIPNASVTIVLKRGAAVPIRIDDAGQFLSQHEGRTPGAGLLLGISSPGSFFHSMPLLSKDSNGRNYQIVVPFNTQLTLVVHPSFYRVNDTGGAPLKSAVSTKIPLFVSSGQQVTPFKLTISGAGN